jgi:outer membrane protein assembly factor BamB
MNAYVASLASCWFGFVQLNAVALDWPQWRGPDRSDVSRETGLLKVWPAGGPKQLWVFSNAGKGYSGPALAQGKLLTMGSRGNREGVLALDTNTGKEIWFTPVGPILANDWGDGPRSTPTIDEDRVYALSGVGILACLNVADGKLLWEQKLTALGGNIPDWGYTESVLVDSNQVVCTPGGPNGALAAFDKKSGKLTWQSKEFTDFAQYASIVPAEINGTRQYIQLTTRNVVGVSATDGKLLWKTPFPGQTAVIPTPIHHAGFVYVTAGYGAGCKLVKITPGNRVQPIYENKVIKNHHGGVVLIGDHVYGHSDGAGWVCQNFKTGQEVWSERRALGKGALTSADGMLYCLDEESGNVALVEASPKGWQERGRVRLAPQSTIRSSQGRIWTHPTISNGKLYLRDQNLIHCYDVKKS